MVTISQHPIPQALLAGSSLNLSVIAGGTGALSYQWYLSSVAIVGATNAQYTVSVSGDADAGSYTVNITDTDNTAISNPALVYIADTIEDNIEANIRFLIPVMTTASGYFFNWAMVNEEEEAIANSTPGAAALGSAFPRAIIDPRDVLADKENSQDTVAGLGSNDYTSEVLFTILANGILPTPDPNENPAFAARSVMRKAKADLKRLFGIYHNLNGACDNVLYVASQIEPIRTGDVQQTSQLRYLMKAIYSQDRQTPTKYAGS